MTRLDTLRSLHQRIREATGPDRELDAEIAIALGADEISVTWVIRTDAIGQRIVVNPASCTEVLLRDFGRYLDLPLYTIDPDGLGACKALMLEVLPGIRRSVHVLTNGNTLVNLIPHQGHLAEGIHALETHATLLAIFSAAISEIEAKQKDAVG